MLERDYQNKLKLSNMYKVSIINIKIQTWLKIY